MTSPEVQYPAQSTVILYTVWWPSPQTLLPGNPSLPLITLLCLISYGGFIVGEVTLWGKFTNILVLAKSWESGWDLPGGARLLNFWTNH